MMKFRGYGNCGGRQIGGRGNPGDKKSPLAAGFWGVMEERYCRYAAACAGIFLLWWVMRFFAST